MSTFSIRPLNANEDSGWLSRFLQEHWGSTRVISRGVIHEADKLPGFVAIWQGQPSGLLTYHIQDRECEIVSLDSTQSGIGIGSALIEASSKAARQAGCKRLWLITSNDNLSALRFYQKRGFALVAIHRNAIEQARKLKPEIPLSGNDGIPIRDEIELELLLDIRQ
ncbi:GNAT family N-acetyltransferase [Ktedonosporobacter rubrisoli]|uniref:GNAT family N-acetyltransferase n=1 Tax=Ktedonosporobacter rubrisoli TaxID=2509675 RepID=A0A4P6K033_KTERU|nr:GNAT family N-acetyltransferase [Ktedonosporobacter rubrisoli]QBD81538.1 GNAT family N-acetyltransferase [Ktedonosporobacter rubrisoli]